MRQVALVDIGSGNYASVRNAFRYLGIGIQEASRPEDLRNASHIVLPGVGAFAKVMERLSRSGFAEELKAQLSDRGKPFLGLCVGMQVLATSGTEFGDHPGLGIVPGKVVRIDAGAGRLPVPHMGWNNLDMAGDNPLFKGLDPAPSFYFVHSFHVVTEDSGHLAASCEYGGRVTACIARDNVFGVQFHPEKSQENGLMLLRNFASL